MNDDQTISEDDLLELFMRMVFADGPELECAKNSTPTLLSMNRFNSGAFKGKNEDGKMDLVDRAASILFNEKDIQSDMEAIGWDTAWVLYPKRTLSIQEKLDLLQIVACKESMKSLEGLYSTN